MHKCFITHIAYSHTSPVYVSLDESSQTNCSLPEVVVRKLQTRSSWSSCPGVIGAGYFCKQRGFSVEVCSLASQLVHCTRQLWQSTKVWHCYWPMMSINDDIINWWCHWFMMSLQDDLMTWFPLLIDKLMGWCGHSIYINGCYSRRWTAICTHCSG